MKTIEKIEKAIKLAKTEIRKNTSIEDRKEVFSQRLAMQGLRFEEIGEKPVGGACFTIKSMKGKYRVNYRCGYGKYNYAPCFEILNEDI